MNVSHILGIDPGLTGAIALINAFTGELFDVTDMPTRKTVTAAGKKATVIDVSALAETLNDYIDHADRARDAVIVIEQQSTRPGLAAGAVFKTGYGYGVIIGAAASTGAHTVTVRPQDWKQWHGLIGAGGDLKGHKRTAAIKTASRVAAMARFPYHADAFWRLRDDGRAEAALVGDAYLRSLTARPVAA